MFAIEIFDTDFTPVLLGPEVVLTPVRPAAAAVGGCSALEIAVGGPREALLDLLNWLRYGVVVRNERGSATWWGYVHEVVIPWRGVEIGLTLSGMANRVAVGYTSTAPGSGATRYTTPWAEDVDSVVRHGAWELLYTRGDMSDEEALRLRNALLAERAQPRGIPARPASGGARLFCRGWWALLGATYYSNPEGLIEFWESGTNFPLGLGFTANTIGFEGNNDAIHDLGDRFKYFDSNRRVRVAGSAGNNAIYTINRSTNQTPYTLNSTVVAFQSADNVTTAVDGLFDEVDANDLIRISGASVAGNNRWTFVDAVTDNGKKIDLRGGGIVDSAAGPAVTIERAISIQVDGTLTTETPGATVTLTLEGMQMAQRVRNPVNVAWTVDEIWISAGKLGAPGDMLIVEWCADNAGSLGALIDSAGMVPTNLSEGSEAVRFVLPTAPTLAADGYGWIVVRRSGANSATDGYQVEIAESGGYGGGPLLLWDGVQWNSNAGALLFVVRSKRSSTAQIADMIGRAGSWVAGVDIVDDSGAPTYRYHAGGERIDSAVAGLLEQGAADGRRLLATVDEQRFVHIYKAPLSTEVTLIIGEGGALTDPYGTPLEPGDLPVGQWATVGDLPPEVAALPGIAPVFLERCAYDARSGLRWEPYDGETGIVQG